MRPFRTPQKIKDRPKVRFRYSNEWMQFSQKHRHHKLQYPMPPNMPETLDLKELNDEK